jgi:hypothetical protein
MDSSLFDRSIGTKPKQSEWNPGGGELLAKLTSPRTCFLAAIISYDSYDPNGEEDLGLDEHSSLFLLAWGLVS